MMTTKRVRHASATTTATTSATTAGETREDELSGVCVGDGDAGGERGGGGIAGAVMFINWNEDGDTLQGTREVKEVSAASVDAMFPTVTGALKVAYAVDAPRTVVMVTSIKNEIAPPGRFAGLTTHSFSWSM